MESQLNKLLQEAILLAFAIQDKWREDEEDVRLWGLRQRAWKRVERRLHSCQSFYLASLTSRSTPN